MDIVNEITTWLPHGFYMNNSKGKRIYIKF